MDLKRGRSTDQLKNLCKTKKRKISTNVRSASSIQSPKPQPSPQNLPNPETSSSTIEKSPTKNGFHLKTLCIEVLEKAKYNSEDIDEDDCRNAANDNSEDIDKDDCRNSAKFFDPKTGKGKSFNTLENFKNDIVEIAKARSVYQNAISNKENDENIKSALRAAVTVDMKKKVKLALKQELGADATEKLGSKIAKILFDKCYGIWYPAKEGHTLFLKEWFKKCKQHKNHISRLFVKNDRLVKEFADHIKAFINDLQTKRAVHFIFGASQIGKTFFVQNILARSGNEENDYYYFVFKCTPHQQLEENFFKGQIMKTANANDISWKEFIKALGKLAIDSGKKAVFIIHIDEFQNFGFQNVFDDKMASDCYHAIQQLDSLCQESTVNLIFFPICTGLDVHGLNTTINNFVTGTATISHILTSFDENESFSFFQNLLDVCTQGKKVLKINTKFKQILKLLQGHVGSLALFALAIGTESYDFQNKIEDDLNRLFEQYLPPHDRFDCGKFYQFFSLEKYMKWENIYECLKKASQGLKMREKTENFANCLPQICLRILKAFFFDQTIDRVGFVMKDITWNDLEKAGMVMLKSGANLKVSTSILHIMKLRGHMQMGGFPKDIAILNSRIDPEKNEENDVFFLILRIMDLICESQANSSSPITMANFLQQIFQGCKFPTKIETSAAFASYNDVYVDVKTISFNFEIKRFFLEAVKPHFFAAVNGKNAPFADFILSFRCNILKQTAPSCFKTLKKDFRVIIAGQSKRNESGKSCKDELWHEATKVLGGMNCGMKLQDKYGMKMFTVSEAQRIVAGKAKKTREFESVDYLLFFVLISDQEISSNKISQSFPTEKLKSLMKKFNCSAEEARSKCNEIKKTFQSTSLVCYFDQSNLAEFYGKFGYEFKKILTDYPA